MRKLSNKTNRSIYKPIKAQYGVGFNFYNPLQDIDNVLNVPKSIAAGYIAGRETQEGISNGRYNDVKDIKERQRLIKRDGNRAGIFSGVLSGINAATNIYKERRDYLDELDRIEKMQANNYKILPFDEYSYKQQSVNPYNASAFKYGGEVDKKYEDGGEVKEKMANGGIPDRYKKMGFTKLNSPKRTSSHPSKSHAVVVKAGEDYKLIRFGQKGVSGSPKKEGESESERKRRLSFKARHAKNIAKGKTSAAYWADKVKW